MEIKTASEDALEEILGIYAHAREFMALNGNKTQWGSVYPPTELVKRDIAEGKCHICVEDGRILCVFYFAGRILLPEDPGWKLAE